MDDGSLTESLETYIMQLQQVEQAILVAGKTDELVALQKDLADLVALTQESLLSLKKSELLDELDQPNQRIAQSEPPRNRNSQSEQPCDRNRQSAASTSESDLDAEFAAFQAAIADDLSTCDRVEQDKIPDRASEQTSSPIIIKEGNKPADDKNNDVSDDDDDTDDSGSEDDSRTMDMSADALVGQKCRVAYRHDWGPLEYHNCVISAVHLGSSESHQTPQVEVMFCNPIHHSMIMCRHFLHGSCRYSHDECRFSHGHTANVDDITEFHEPDYSQLAIEKKCLARYSDDVWYPATIVDIVESEHQYTVIYDSYANDTHVLELEDIIPIGDSQRVLSDASSSDDDDDLVDDSLSNPNPQNDDNEDDAALPTFLWQPPQTTEALGEWESHTKGIASKIMAKMGYIVGQGLGVKGEGRAEPLPIQLLPQGKSLDKIMELKELSGDQDLYDVLKKRKRIQKYHDQKSVQAYHKQHKTTNLFTFLNKTLAHRKGRPHNKQKKQNDVRASSRQISESELTKRNDVQLNIQLLKTNEEIKRTEKELINLRQTLKRNQNSVSRLGKHTQEKIISAQKYLEKLKTSEQLIERHRQKRSDHKKLAVF